MSNPFTVSNIFRAISPQPLVSSISFLCMYWSNHFRSPISEWMFLIVRVKSAKIPTFCGLHHFNSYYIFCGLCHMFRIKPLNTTKFMVTILSHQSFYLSFPIPRRKFHSPWRLEPRMIRTVAPPLALAASCGAKRSSRLLVIDGGGL